MPESVFTIYNCGTNFNRTQTDELVANLASRTIGKENAVWMVNDGPGSDKNGGILPGTKDPITGADLKVAKWWVKIQGICTGLGWESNVVKTIHTLKGLSPKATTVNMVGWSRGAITCTMIAHAMKEVPELAPIKVNIFAIDPVPGPGHWNDVDKVTIPDNVKNYTAVLMEDEQRKIMKAVPVVEVVDDEAELKRKVYPMPGGHSTGVMRKDNEVGTIVAFLAHKWLGKRGTTLKDPMTNVIKPKELCELYAKVRLDLHEFRKKKGSLVQRKLLGTEKRTIANHFDDTLYFVNNHHANQFQKEFPSLWKAFDDPKGFATDVAQKELKRMQQSFPTTYKSIESVGVLGALTA